MSRMRTWINEDNFDDFIGGDGIVEPGDDMPIRYRSEVFRFIEMHANSELFGGLCEQHWVSRAPGLHRKLAFLAKTQDEIGHAHLLYMVAADMGVKTRQQMLDDLFAGRSKFHNVFHYKTQTWADQIVIAFLVDAAALTTQQAVLKNCSYGPYRRVLRRIVAEEGFHMRHGEEMLLTMADGTITQRLSPVQIGSDSDWTHICAGYSGFSIARKSCAPPKFPAITSKSVLSRNLS